MLQTITETGQLTDFAGGDGAYYDYQIAQARDSFWEYRKFMNLRHLLRGHWCPRALARELRRFYEEWKAGRLPILLLMAPPQHGKSWAATDFVAWVAGKNPDLKTIFAS
jgi:hypothetical protein